MKKYFLGFIGLILCLSGCIDPCFSGKKKHKYIDYEPVYLSYEELRSSVKSIDPQPLIKPGKIYVMDNYLFVNEIDKGIHIIDNIDPANPLNISFITIPGNVDIAVKGNILFADSYIDMVAIDIADVKNISEKIRVKDIFPYRYPERTEGNTIVGVSSGYRNYSDSSQGIIIGYRQVEREWEEDPCSSGMMKADAAPASSQAASATGTAGSMARFAIVSNYLYALTGSDVQLFDITNPQTPTIFNKFSVGWDIETIFPYKDKLFIGGKSGMYIYNNSDPANPHTYEKPQPIVKFEHIIARDPVVVNDEFAYVTLRDGGGCCGGTRNELQIIDIKTIENPTLLKTYPLQGPYGLGIDKNILFICDGRAGIKVFDATDPLNLVLKSHIGGFETYDVILMDGVAIVTGAGGIYQYDYQDIENLKQLSIVPINNITPNE